jgi:hypothetical protein
MIHNRSLWGVNLTLLVTPPGKKLPPYGKNVAISIAMKNLYALEGAGAGYVTRGEVLVGLGGARSASPSKN